MRRRFSAREVLMRTMSRGAALACVVGGIAAVGVVGQARQLAAAREAAFLTAFTDASEAAADVASEAVVSASGSLPVDRLGRVVDDGELVGALERTIQQCGLTVTSISSARRTDANRWLAVSVELECEGPLRAVGAFVHSLRQLAPQSALEAFTIMPSARPPAMTFRCTVVQRMPAAVSD